MYGLPVNAVFNYYDASCDVSGADVDYVVKLLFLVKVRYKTCILQDKNNGILYRQQRQRSHDPEGVMVSLLFCV